MLACKGSARWALAACAVAALAMCAGPASANRRTARTAAKKSSAASQQAAAQAAPAFTPGITLVPEVMTPQGQPRMYPVGGGNQSIWQPGMPIYIGDRIILRPFAATGGTGLKEMRVRLDNEPLTTLTQAPWAVTIDTSNWKPGYHFVEVFGQSTDPKAQMGSSTIVFFAREPMPAVASAPAEPTTVTESTITAETEMTQPEPVTTAVAGSRETPAGQIQAPPHPGKAVPMDANGVPQFEANLDARIHSRDTAAEQMIQAGDMVRVTAPTLFYVQGGQAARFFVYSLTRDGKEIFRSEPLPINSLIRLQPKADPQSVGLNAGDVNLWVWASDGQDLFGAPDMVRVNIVPGA